ncbi:MAG: hypothetical protein CHH17_05255 [Candidatus Fluviicola riflensis]|nr:MAG: hypothetical protein CHH17_05255 [Candidatus Fluviicola riflensis]
MRTISSISVVGAGNVAVHLATGLLKAGVRIESCWNRTPEKATKLATLLQCDTVSKIEDLAESDLILCAVSDDALPLLIPQLSALARVVTTSGTVDVLSLSTNFPAGVFYPLQTFSSNRTIDLTTVPIFVESTSPEFTRALLELGNRISQAVTELPWEKRVQLHLAAVFVNNFTNHLIDLAQQQLTRADLSFDWLKPLLLETVEKLNNQTAYDAQTGPARRADLKTIEQHIAMLPPEQAAIYKLLSSSIQQRYKQHD